MKFTRELTGTLTIRSVGVDGIRINDQLWDSTVALTPQAVVAEWPEKRLDELTVDDFASLLLEKPELVLLGTGTTNEFPPRELVFGFARLGIGLEAMQTAAAARTFNVLAGEGRRVAALLMHGKNSASGSTQE